MQRIKIRTKKKERSKTKNNNRETQGRSGRQNDKDYKFIKYKNKVIKYQNNKNGKCVSKSKGRGFTIFSMYLNLSSDFFFRFFSRYFVDFHAAKEP